MSQRNGRVTLNKELNNHRSFERIHCDFSYEEDVMWYGRGAAGVLAIGARHTGFVQPVRSRPAAAVQSVSSSGVSGKAFLAIVMAVVFALVIPVANTLIEMTELSKAVDALNESIKSVEATIALQREELSTKNSQFDVQYLAAQMGMHAATERDTVKLTVHEN